MRSLSAKRRAISRRNLLAGVETMERRCVMDASPWCNVALPADVNNDGIVSELDVSAVQTTIANGSSSSSSGVPVQQGTSPSNGGFPDATNDWWVNQADVDFVNSAIAQGSGSGSGSASGTVSGSGSGSGTGSSSGTSSGYGWFEIGDAQPVGEGGTLLFPVTFHGNATGPSVTIGFGSGTAGGSSSGGGGGGGTASASDFNNGSVTMTITGVDGEVHYISVATTQDNIVEWNETVVATITSTQCNYASIGGVGDTGIGTIVDDDTCDMNFSVSSNNLESTAGVAGSATITVTFTAPVELPGQTFTYSTQDSTAIAGKDYVGGGGSFTLPAGVSNGFTKTVPFINDFVLEDLTESFKITFAGIGPKVIVDQNPQWVDIKDDDVCYVQLLASGLSATEGGSMTATVMFVGNSDIGGATVDLWTQAGTAAADDGTGGDYVTPGSPTHVSLAGVHGTTATVTISIKDDNTVEAMSEWFNVIIGNLVTDNPSAAGRITPRFATQVATITDNDASTISISDVSTWEEDWLGYGVEQKFYVTLSKPVDVPITINVTLGTGGSSPTGFVFGQDVTATAGTVIPITFNPGETSKSFSVWTKYDLTTEGGGWGGIETYLATITSWSYPAPGSRNVTIVDGVGQGTIISNDP